MRAFLDHAIPPPAQLLAYTESMRKPALVLLAVACVTHGITIPSTAPSTASTVDPALLSVSLEFFAFPQYTTVTSTSVCLGHIADLRGTYPAVRIGGTTQYVVFFISADLPT